MNTTLKRSLFVGSLAAVSVFGIKQYKRSCAKQNQSISDSAELDRRPSVDQTQDESEVGLTQLDSIQKAEWQANGFPQTHAERERLENEEV